MIFVIKIRVEGLIASVSSGGNTGDINLVKSLIQSYISKPSCIILLTITCESQPQILLKHKCTFSDCSQLISGL